MAVIAILTAIIIISMWPFLLVAYGGETAEHGDFKDQL